VVRSASGDVIVFCEVKARTSDRFGSPFEAVTPAKQRRLRRLAARWLSSGHGSRGAQQIRFDVAAVTPGPGGTLRVEVLEDAF
jgi:putative endonuclease